MSSLISQGGYGCVFHPSLSCSGKSEKNEKKVSKLQKKDWASRNEIHVGKIIIKINNYKLFFLPITSSCDINISNVDKNILEECRVVKKKPDAKFVLMKMNYLENMSFINYIQISNQSREYSISKFIQSYRILCESLKILNNAEIVHHDLKMDNILIDKFKKIPIIIDFGISIDMKKISVDKESILDEYFYIHAPDYYPWSLEIHIINYIVQTRLGEGYGPLVFEELQEIVEKWCNFNPIFKSFSKDFLDQFKKKSNEYVRQFVGKNDSELLDILLKTWKKWDIYSLSSIYIKLIIVMFNGKFPDTNFLAEICQMLLINLSPNPNERLDYDDTINYLEDIVNRHDSLQDLIATADKVDLNVEKLSESEELEENKLNKMKFQEINN